MLNRMIRAARLEPQLYEEVEHDKTANWQAFGVVVLSSLAAGIGSITSGGVNGLIFGIITALGSWLIWSGLILFIGTKLLPTSQTEADYGQLLRTLGFATSPGLIRILGLIPFLEWITTVVAALWMLAATVIAVRQALDYTSTWRAIGVVGIGWLIQLALLLIFRALVA